jgi:hypothetical protein
LRLRWRITSSFAASTPYTNDPAIECTATRASGVRKPSIVTQWKKTGSVKSTARRPDQMWTRLAFVNDRGTTAWSFPHIRDAVSTWTTASTIAAVASHALAAIVDENTVSTTSAYVELTSAIVTGRA